MANNIIHILTDYKNNFGSKWKAKPYRSGLDKEYLKELFAEKGFEIKFIPYMDVNPTKEWRNQVVIYTSSEDYGLFYKSFIEDVVYSLKLKGAYLLPAYEFLRANNNKVFMELLRKTHLPLGLQSIESKVFGTYEELLSSISKGEINYPCVLKKSAGAMSRGVFLAENKTDLLKKVKKISYSGSALVKMREIARSKKHKGYQVESDYQYKFIIQPFVPNLKNDWKILIYGEIYFILKRNIKQNDFRASGSGLNYTCGSESGFPLHMLDMVREFYKNLDIPHLSVDFAYDGQKGYIFEFQGIHFGTSTHYKSEDYYEFYNGDWLLKKNDIDQEQVYVHSIVEYLKQNHA